MRKPRTVKRAETFKRFSSTATKGVGTIVCRGEKRERAQVLQTDPATRARGAAGAATGLRLRRRSAAAAASAGDELHHRLREADHAEPGRRESREAAVTFPGKGSHRQTAAFGEGAPPRLPKPSRPLQRSDGPAAAGGSTGPRLGAHHGLPRLGSLESHPPASLIVPTIAAP